MTKNELVRTYRDYIACLNSRDLTALERYVDGNVSHNGRQLGVAGYREMLENDFAAIPDLHFNVELLIVDPPHVASRLRFTCTPRATFLGLNIGGTEVSFAENVFYEFAGDKIIQVWSVIDKLAIEAQLQSGRPIGARPAVLGELMEPIESRSDRRHTLIAATPAQVFAAMRDPARVAKWWGPAGFTNTIHKYDFEPGGSWLLTMHGPDGTDYPNESRFTRIVPDRLFEIEHLGGHHFVLTLELQPHAAGTNVMWRQTFDTSEHYKALAEFVATANEQNLERLAVEVARGQSAA